MQISSNHLGKLLCVSLAIEFATARSPLPPPHTHTHTHTHTHKFSYMDRLKFRVHMYVPILYLCLLYIPRFIIDYLSL